MTGKETEFLDVQQYFQMTITKILQVCYLTHTDTTKLVYHWENYSWVGVSYQLPGITIKRTKTRKIFKFFRCFGSCTRKVITNKFPKKR